MPTVLSSSWKARERVASNDLLAEIHYPDTTRINIGPIDKPQPTLLDYNRQGEVVAMRELQRSASNGADRFVAWLTRRPAPEALTPRSWLHGIAESPGRPGGCPHARIGGR